MRAVTALLTATLLSAPAGADDPKPAAGWSMFRGRPDLTGVAPADALPRIPKPVAGEDGLELVWTAKTGAGIESSAAIVGGVVYLSAERTADNRVVGELLALHLADGKVKWTARLENPSRSSPAVAAGKVFVGDDGGVLYAFDAATGKPAWQFRAEDKIAGSAVVHDGKVMVGSYDGHLYAVNAADGKEAWKFKTEDQPVNCTPAIAGGAAFISGCDQYLRVIDIGTGKETAAINMDGQAGASPAVVGDRAYVGTFNNTFLCIDWKAKRVVWAYRNADREFPFYSSAAVTDKLAVVGGRDKLVHAIDRGTGKAVWTFQTRGKVDSSPLVVGDWVLVGSHDRKFYALDLATGRKLFEFAAGAAIAASPAVAEGRVVIANDEGDVFCFRRK
jgi:outer membrane protein assembly factor BamB